MRLTFLLHFLIFLLNTPLYGNLFCAWNVTLSLALHDYDVDFESSLTIRPKNRFLFRDTIKALVEAGVKLDYKDRQFFCNLFSKIIFKQCLDKGDQNKARRIISDQSTAFSRHDIANSNTTPLIPPKNSPQLDKTAQISPPVNPNDRNKAGSQARYKLNIELNYSLSLSELSLKIAPYYNGDKTSLLKNLLFCNFLARHYKKNPQGRWTFVGYETADGYRSLDDFKNKELNVLNKQAINNLNNRLGGQDLDSFKKVLALTMADISNKELKIFWTELFESISTGFYEGLNKE